MTVKSVGIPIDPATRTRVERIWALWNQKAERGEHPWPILSKSAIYRALISWGCGEYERALGIRPPKGSDQFWTGSGRPFAKPRPRKIGQVAVEARPGRRRRGAVKRPG